MASEFWFKFDFKAWADDVKPLSLMARGLLIELMILLRKPAYMGKIKIDYEMFGRATGGNKQEVEKCIEEFKTHGTFNFENGFIISRRITRELHISNVNSANGAAGVTARKPKRIPRQPKENKFQPPLVAEVNAFFIENNFPQQLGERAWNYYNDNDWKDSNGKQVKNWRQKMRGVWFKEENKIKPDSKTTAAPNPNDHF